MSLLAQLIGRMEGFGIPGAKPTRFHNPGDLRHSPHSSHPADDPDGIGQIDNDADGWADLERQLGIDVERHWTLRQLIETYAPPNENDTEGYLKFVCAGLSLPPTATVAQALKVTGNVVA